MGVIVLNPNLNFAPKKFIRPEREMFFIRGKPKVPQTAQIRIPNNETPEIHMNTVWDLFAKKSAAKDMVLVAHSYGGVVTLNLLKERSEALQRIRAIAFTDSVHRIHFGDSKNAIKFLKQNAINWVRSTKVGLLQFLSVRQFLNQSPKTDFNFNFFQF